MVARAWLLFILLQDLIASARPNKMHKKNLLPKSVVHYSYYLKLNNIVTQIKTTNIEKQFYP